MRGIKNSPRRLWERSELLVMRKHFYRPCLIKKFFRKNLKKTRNNENGCRIFAAAFLFQALLPGGWKSAVLISSLTFGIGHLVNLFNSSGADLFGSVLQVFYAVAIGFLFTILFLRTGSLYACILTHGIFNALSVFANESARTPEIDILSAAFLTVTALAYAIYILRKTPSNQL